MDAHQDSLLEMKKLAYAMLQAKEYQGETVVYHRKDVLEEAVITLDEDPAAKLNLFGVKDTKQISKDLVDKLKEKKGFLFHTVDKMSKGGRAIDTELINPLTGRVMTGSSSASSINILKGINDFSIGTDGGGSVLAPAISTGLYSIMAKGMGLEGISQRLSTESITFTPGIGIISHDFQICKEVIEHLCDVKPLKIEKLNKKIKIAIPKESTFLLPNKVDSYGFLKPVMDSLEDVAEFIETDFGDLSNREESIKMVNEIFEGNIDFILNIEGPIDIYGLGDSVLGQFGHTGNMIQSQGGKYLLKIANMIDATSISIPTGELGTGILITGKKGIENGKIAIGLGDIISKSFEKNGLFQRYFIDGYLQGYQGFI